MDEHEPFLSKNRTKKYRLRFMANVVSPAKRQEIIIDYKYGRYSNMEIAKRHTVTNATVRNILIEAGIYKPQRSSKNRKLKSKYVCVNRESYINGLSILRTMMNRVGLNLGVNKCEELIDIATKGVNKIYTHDDIVEILRQVMFTGTPQLYDNGGMHGNYNLQRTHTKQRAIEAFEKYYINKNPR